MIRRLLSKTRGAAGGLARQASKVGVSRSSATMAVAAVLLMYHGEDAVQVLAESVGHEWRDILITMLVKFTYVILGLSILIAGLKPVYRKVDALTAYHTDVLVERLGHTGPAIIVAAAIASYILGGCIFLGMVFQP